MEAIISDIKSKFDDFVVVGSYALFLQGLIPEFSGKDIDIVVNCRSDKFENDPTTIKNAPTRFSDYGWVFQTGGMWVEAFSDILPSFDLFRIGEHEVKVKTVKACRDFYRNIETNKINSHSKFITKLESYKSL